MVSADGDDEYTIPADEISSDVDEDGTIIHRKVSGVEYYYYYTTIEVPVQ
jgi:H2-forming N5,N10-methylenetetrahydromethanopterin dehydrogenase-like enzyme